MNPLSYHDRAQKAKHPQVKRLFELMEKKKSNLSLAADLTRKNALLKLVDFIGPSLCLLKTHIDILEDFDKGFIQELKALSQQHQFLIFEDRKFADIGHTVSLQYARGLYHISSWADFINAHPIVGPGVIEGLKKENQGQALLLLAQMSSQGHLMKEGYLKQVLKLADEYSDFVGGFISMGQVSANPAFIHMTPGVQLQEGKDSLKQSYQSIEQVLSKKMSDLIIVGRALYEASNPQEKALEYQKAGWQAYLTRL